MRRQNKIEAHENRNRLTQHKLHLESERGWAGQHGQHPESEEEENYHPSLQAERLEDEKEG